MFFSGLCESCDGNYLYRTGGSCGLMMPSGASCSPSSCWLSCFCGDHHSITRGRAGEGGIVGISLFFTVVKAQFVSVRYAFSPLLDEESEEEEKEPVMNEAFGQKPFLPSFPSLPVTLLSSSLVSSLL